MTDSFDWVDEKEKEIKDERAKSYFDIKEGKQTFVLLSHCAPLAQIFDPATKKYRPAAEGDKGASIKGVCWVLQDGLIKQAKLPYTLVKVIRGLQQNSEWEFAIPFLHTFTLDAVGAGTKEVKYTLTPSPKKVELTPEIQEELKKKRKPEEIVDFIKNGRKKQEGGGTAIEYPADDINPEDIPF